MLCWAERPRTIAYLRRLMTKPTMWLCAQRRLRSAWASAQSDQSLRCPHEESLDPWLPFERTAKTLVRLADAQADLSLRWAHNHFVGFKMRRLNLWTGWFPAQCWLLGILCNKSVKFPHLEKKGLFSLLIAKLSTMWHPCLFYSLMCANNRTGGCQVWKCFWVSELGQMSNECKINI